MLPLARLFWSSVEFSTNSTFSPRVVRNRANSLLGHHQHEGTEDVDADVGVEAESAMLPIEKMGPTVRSVRSQS